MSIKQAIILAGGLGTRLRSAVPDLPKCMAIVAGKPFLSYVIDFLLTQGIEKFIFSLGYKSEIIERYLDEHYPGLHFTTVVEREPLGTGGAIKLASTKATNDNVLVANGDTLFKINGKQVFDFHLNRNAECTVALKPMNNFDRYGAVELDHDRKIVSFKEKQFYEQGLINGGVYILNIPGFLKHDFPEKFSFEKKYLEANTNSGSLYGCVQDVYFIDIGIPEDYNKAQEDLRSSTPDLKNLDKVWTLFLDRDGVINEERVGEYVLNWKEFSFMEGALEALKILSEKFDRIVIITNQRGIGKGLMTEEDLADIHNKMQKEIVAAGGRIDKIFYCTDINARCYYRKPNPGMAFQALNEVEGVDLGKSIMVGNKPSDMRFGRSAGMTNVFITSTNPHQPFPHPDIDFRFSSLIDFARAIES